MAHRASDLQKCCTACLCGRCAKVGKDGRSIEVRHTSQIFLIQIVRRVYTTAGQQFVLGAGANQIAECDLDVEIVQLLQKTVRFFINKVLCHICTDLQRQLFAGIHQQSAEVCAITVKFLSQHFTDRRFMLRAHLPDPRRFAVLDRVGICNIMDIGQIRLTAVAFADEGDRRCSGIDPAVHLVVPEPDVRAGGSIGALGIDEELIVKIIGLVEPGRCGEEVHPRLRRMCDLFTGMCKQAGDRLYFRHSVASFNAAGGASFPRRPQNGSYRSSCTLAGFWDACFCSCCIRASCARTEVGFSSLYIWMYSFARFFRSAFALW